MRPRGSGGILSWSTSHLYSSVVDVLVERPASTSDDKTAHFIVEIELQEVTVGGIKGQHASAIVRMLKEDNGHFSLWR